MKKRKYTAYTKEFMINAINDMQKIIACISTVCNIRIEQNNSALEARHKFIDNNSLHSQNSLAREILNLIGTTKLKK